MPRAALIRAAPWWPVLVGLSTVFLAPAGLSVAAALDPHVDPIRVTGGCTACHEGHGASGAPMLPTAQVTVCLRCHGTLGRLAEQVAQGRIAPGVEPPSVASALAQPFTHPLSDSAFSIDDPGAVVCTSCHSPHRAPLAVGAGSGVSGERKLSPRSPDRFEFELCGTCHGGVPGNPGPSDVGRLLEPRNRSYHPVQAPALDPSPSVRPELQGRFVNCTDCHGNGDPGGSRGPHGSPVRSLLGASYSSTDGGAESPTTYALCYGCHDRATLLDSSVFPEHRKHIDEERASCSTCHNPHGSVTNRALIRFDESASPTGVGPSGATGRLAYISTAPGSGVCYLTCHGEDHSPETYGAVGALEAGPGGTGTIPVIAPSPRDWPSPPPSPPGRTPPERPPVRPPEPNREPAP